MRGRKDEIRSEQRRRTLSEAERTSQSAALTDVLSTIAAIARADAVSMFVGKDHEPDTASLFERLAPRARWFPTVTGRTALGWTEVREWSELTPGRFGLLEPAAPTHAQMPDSVQVVLVPGLAFDRYGGRLGWGRGFYDRALAAVPSALRIGVCLRPGLVATVLPMDAHDRPMHAVVTPDGVVFGENTLRGSQ
ncbi:MAG: 5-formyltetrahydrofolate cyclo-ligase [Myxococcota bacterium]